MILVDANVIMYAAGAEHPFKVPSVAFLDGVARGETRATIDAETLQEILHRYRAIGRWREGREAYDLVRQLFDHVLPVTDVVLDRARRLLDLHDGISARDALHAAVVLTHSLDGICSYDRGFDVISGLRRFEPSLQP